MTTSSESEPGTRAPNSTPKVPDWTRISDGKVWRLKQGREFDCSTKRLRAEARMAARDMGKTVRFVRDRIDPYKYLWLQFADDEMILGQPCPKCGGEHLLQLSGQFVRCGSCRALLAVERPPDVEDVELQMREAAHAAGGVEDTLQGYSDVHLSVAETDAEHQRLVGYGFDGDGHFTLLYVVAPLAGGKRVPDASTAGFLHSVELAVVEPFGNLVDVSSLLRAELESFDISLP